MHLSNLFRHAARTGGAALLAAGALLAGACEGDNLYRTLPTGGGTRADAAAPTVKIVTPEAGSRVAVGDSVFLQVRVADDHAVASLEVRGVALRGDPQLGTQTEIERFQTKKVQLAGTGRVVRDTTISRFLLPGADSLPDSRVLLIAVAKDTIGNVKADTLAISVGGPRVQLVSPTTGGDARAGASLRVRLSASDPTSRIQELTVRVVSPTRRDTTLRFDPPLTRVDTSVVIDIASTTQGDSLVLRAIARTAANDSAVSSPVSLRLLPPIRDVLAPTVSFTVNAAGRLELRDSVTIQVSATDSTQVDSVGVTVLPLHRLATRTDTLTPLSLRARGESGTFRFSLAQLGVPVPTDTSTLRLEITAMARDTAGNCATATIAATPTSEACEVRNGHVYGTRSGARTEILLVRGTTIALQSPSDRIADLASDGSRVYLSNLSRNRLDVIRVGDTTITSSVSVGARPWGLAFNRDRSRLYVANSGGTNISVVSPATGREEQRIQTPNVKLFNSEIRRRRVEFPIGSGDSIDALVPAAVQRFDYSDRPQFIGVTRNNNLIYSTRPTGAAPDGTVRILYQDQDRLEIVTDYAEERVAGRVVIANADSVFLIAGDPYSLIQVCPRNRSLNRSLDRNLEKRCFTGLVDWVQDSIRSAGYDTKFLYNLNIAEIGLTDTTFVAVSGDHSTVAFGEGNRQNARLMVFRDSVGAPGESPLRKSGEIADIVGNTAERVIGLGLNQDGSLGIARGAEAYYFSDNLRLQGVVATGAQAGGVDMHPSNPEVNRSFVSGVESNGLAYVDVVDTFHFRRVARIFMRDPVTGPIRAVRTDGGRLMIYAVTARGVVALEVRGADL